MMASKNQSGSFFGISTRQDGFTLIELMIAMVVSIILGGAVVTSYISQQRAATMVREVAQMQQQLRGAMYILEYDLRLAGFNPMAQTGRFGVMDMRRRDMADGKAGEGSPTLTVRYDYDPGAPLADTNGNGEVDPGEPLLTYGLFDETANGVTDLVRVSENDFVNRALLAENIEAMAIAYAYADGNGQLTTVGGDIAWAMDTNDDNRLDTLLDGTVLTTTVPLSDIRMARVWLLARSQNRSAGHVDNISYQIGAQTVGPFQDAFRRRMMDRTIELRNMALGPAQ